MTYLEIVNSVMVRLRETKAATVASTSYSQLIGELVNDAKRYCEDAWDWSALRTTLTASTEKGIFAYTLTGSGQRIKVLRVFDDTNNRILQYQTADWMSKAYLTPLKIKLGQPSYYSFNGVNSAGDTQIEIYPAPDAPDPEIEGSVAYQLRFDVVKRTARWVYEGGVDEVDDATKLTIPSDPVIQWAYAYALRERGESGGQSAQEQVLFAQQSLSDAIALDAQKHPEETIWMYV